MDQRFVRLAELSVHGSNVQPGQIVIVSAELGQEDLARAVAAAAYDRGAKFVDVNYFDPLVKRARIEHADPETLDFVPAWYGERLLAHAEARGARVTLAGATAPNLLDDLDSTLVGRDRLPYLKEIPKIVGDRSTNWCIVPCPHPAWAKLVHPELSEADAYEKLWGELEHVFAPRRARPGTGVGGADGRPERLGAPSRGAQVRRDRTARPGHRADGGAAADAHLVGGRLPDRGRVAALPEPADRGGLHDPGPGAYARPRHLDEAARVA